MTMNKKRVLAALLLMTLTFSTSCTKPETPVAPDVSESLVVTDTSATPDFSELPEFEHYVVEYGDLTAIDDNSQPLLTYIRYPQAGNPTDRTIAKWAKKVRQNALADLAKLQESDPDASGEVNVHFNSFLVGDSYASVVETGMRSLSNMAHPEDIVRVFNIDIKRGVMLEAAEILDPAQTDSVLALLKQKILADYPDMKDSLSKMDSKWLANVALGHNEVYVILKDGMFLPSSLGRLSFELSYEELGSALVLFDSPPPTAPETEAPTTAQPAAPSGEQPPSSGEQPSQPSGEQPPASNVQQPPSSGEQPSPPSGDIDPSKPMIALTFDDGPSQYTSRILDLLDTYGGHVTFCTVGNLLKAHKETVARASSMGCEVIGHSWDHKDLTNLTDDEIEKEILHTYKTIDAITGDAPLMYRPPYGAVDDSVKRVSKKLGFALICWSVDPEDWKTRNADAVYSAVMGNVSDKAIVLSHDLYETTAEAYERIIPELIAQGYQLVTVSELITYSGYEFKPGTVYYDGT